MAVDPTPVAWKKKEPWGRKGRENMKWSWHTKFGFEHTQPV